MAARQMRPARWPYGGVMADRYSSPAASSEHARLTMRANRRRDTRAEIEIRRRLHRSGARYRVDYAPDPGDRRKRADIVFTRSKIVVYVDGCFWHGCPAHYIEPKTNVDYWRPKIARNVARDTATSEALERQGWTVLRYWEHEDPDSVAEDILSRLPSRSERP